MTTTTATTPSTAAAAAAAAATNTNGTSSAASQMSQLSGNFSTFLTLLTTQLKNQDPTSPMDSNTFTQQLVEYSQVEQQIDTNTNLQTLITQGQSSGSAMATTYLGKQVTVTNGEASLAGGTANWNYNLGTDAANTTLSVTNASGKTVYTGAGETASGAHTFTWDGEDNNGNTMPDGAYTLSVTATASDSSAVTSAVSSTGTVNEVDMTGSAPQLVIGSLRIGLGQIANVQ